MSGHSKWAQIKRQKGTADVKKGLAFTKLANAITIAVREGGGGDPEQNFRLRLAIEKAREQNTPKENIQRAIDRGLGKGVDAASFQEAAYEGFIGQVGLIIEAITDNTQRTTSEVKNILEKNGGQMVSIGAVSYQFQKMGMIIINKSGKSFDEIFTVVVDLGCEDVEEVGDEVFVYTLPENLNKIKEALTQKGLIVTTAEFTRKPKIIIPISDKSVAEKTISIIDKLEELDDVQRVYANFEIADPS